MGVARQDERRRGVEPQQVAGRPLGSRLELPGSPHDRPERPGDFDDAAASEERFREAADTAEGADRLVLLTQVARALGLQERYEAAHGVLDDLAVSDPEVATRVSLERGRLHRSAGDTEAAAPHFESAAATAREAGLEVLHVDALHMLALVAPADEALERNHAALAVARAAQSEAARDWDASLLNNIGMTHADAEQWTAGLAAFEEALEARERIGDDGRTRVARWMVGWAAQPGTPGRGPPGADDPQGRARGGRRGGPVRRRGARAAPRRLRCTDLLSGDGRRRLGPPRGRARDRPLAALARAGPRSAGLVALARRRWFATREPAPVRRPIEVISADVRMRSARFHALPEHASRVRRAALASAYDLVLGECCDALGKAHLLAVAPPGPELDRERRRVELELHAFGFPVADAA